MGFETEKPNDNVHIHFLTDTIERIHFGVIFLLSSLSFVVRDESKLNILERSSMDMKHNVTMILKTIRKDINAPIYMKTEGKNLRQYERLSERLGGCQ